MPGCEWMKIIYSDNDVVIRQKNKDTVVCYHRATYKTPLFGKEIKEWLCCGEWHWLDNMWFKYYSNNNASTIEEIVEIIKNGE